MLLNPNQFLFIISFDPSSEFDTVDHSPSSSKVSSCGLQGTTVFGFLFSSLVASANTPLRVSLYPPDRNHWSDSGLRPQSLLSLHYFGYHISFLDDFKNHFSMDNSQMDNCILDLFSKLNISLFRYLIDISSSATPKSRSYHSLQICPSQSLLHISK